LLAFCSHVSAHALLQVSELDDTLDRLENRCNRFVKGSKKYKEGINVLSQSQTSFADFLEEFCGGTDEESMLLGVLTSVLLSRPVIAAYHILLVHPCGAAVGSLIVSWSSCHALSTKICGQCIAAVTSWPFVLHRRGNDE